MTDGHEAGGETAAPPTRSLFLLAHHDDEVFCAAHLRRRLAAGGEVAIIWVTAGGLAPAPRRIAEGDRVRALLGLPPARTLDLALRDRRAIEHLATIESEVERLLAKTLATELFAPASRANPMRRLPNCKPGSWRNTV